MDRKYLKCSDGYLQSKVDSAVGDHVPRSSAMEGLEASMEQRARLEERLKVQSESIGSLLEDNSVMMFRLAKLGDEEAMARIGKFMDTIFPPESAIEVPKTETTANSGLS